MGDSIARPVPIPRGSGKGEWWEWHGQTWIRCPGCGAAGALSHSISNEGLVQPSVECPQTCGFHEFVKLLDWPGEGV